MATQGRAAKSSCSSAAFNRNVRRIVFDRPRVAIRLEA
jgi:hypothetical protein